MEELHVSGSGHGSRSPVSLREGSLVELAAGHEAGDVLTQLHLEVLIGTFAALPAADHLRQLRGKGDVAGVVPHY